MKSKLNFYYKNSITYFDKKNQSLNYDYPYLLDPIKKIIAINVFIIVIKDNIYHRSQANQGDISLLWKKMRCIIGLKASIRCL